MNPVLTTPNLIKSIQAFRQASGRLQTFVQVTLRPEWGFPEQIWLEQQAVVLHGNVFFPVTEHYKVPIETPGLN